MKNLKNKKLYPLVLFVLVTVVGGLTLSGCAKTDNESQEDPVVEETETPEEEENSEEVEQEKQETEAPEEEVKVLKGTIREGMMQTLVVTGEDGIDYQFERNDEIITTGETGLQIGNPITVEYKGELNPDVDYQEDVEVILMTVEDAE